MKEIFCLYFFHENTAVVDGEKNPEFVFLSQIDLIFCVYQNSICTSFKLSRMFIKFSFQTRVEMCVRKFPWLLIYDIVDNPTTGKKCSLNEIM